MVEASEGYASDELVMLSLLSRTERMLQDAIATFRLLVLVQGQLCHHH
jgi:hypothetical protein